MKSNTRQPEKPANQTGRVLIIAGSDSSGGAGIQADIKSVTALGGYAMTAITAITVQNTLGVSGVVPVPIAAIRAQISACLSDIGADTIKTGMLGSKNVVEAVAEALALEAKALQAVIDPVMVAKGGARLLDRDAVEAVVSILLPLAGLLTPNAPEAEVLTGKAVESVDGQRRAADSLLRAGARAVLVKGGHIGGDRVVDVLATHSGERIYESARIDSRATHGTGCTLASAIAALLSQGVGLEEAVERARAYVTEAIRRAPGYGKGHSPLNHGWTMQRDT